MKKTKLVKISDQLTSSLWERFMEIGLPDRGACVMGDEFARYYFVKKRFILLVINTPKRKSMSLHPAPDLPADDDFFKWK